MLRYRLISGAVMGLLLVLAALYSPPLVVLGILVVVSVLGQVEFYAMIRAQDLPVSRWLGVAAGVCLIVITFFAMGPDSGRAAAAYRLEDLVMLLCLLGLMVDQVFCRHRRQPLANVAFTMLGVCYVPYLLNFFTRLAFEWAGDSTGLGIGVTGCRLILFLVLVVKITDAGAYTFGRLFGRHPLCPSLSPKKTWEGAIGGVACAVAAACVFVAVARGKFGSLTFGMGDAVVLGALLSAAGQVGDLFESLAKRAAGIKDSGRAIPGMGGVLDVLDSLLFGAPVLYIYARFVLC